MSIITRESIDCYVDFLKERRRAGATIQKYVHYLLELSDWMDLRPITKKDCVDWIETLALSPRTVNTAISALNGYCRWAGESDISLPFNKVETPYFRSESRDLKKAEYERLVATARSGGKSRIAHTLITIATLGIRVSELRYITVEALNDGAAEITNKGKTRRVLIPGKLRKQLLAYCRKENIRSGPVFITRNQQPLSRGQIWYELKQLAKAAGVSSEKVFPHNLRHLFAVIYYKVHRDIVSLSRILGHSSVKTTQIYLVTSGETLGKGLEELGFIL